MAAKTFAERIRRSRTCAGMSGERLAALLGSDAHTISRWEQGRFKPREPWRGLALAVVDSVAQCDAEDRGDVEIACQALSAYCKLIESFDSPSREILDGARRLLEHAVRHGQGPIRAMARELEREARNG